jgi:O-antigen ligase
MWFYLAILLSATLAIIQYSVGMNFVLRRLRPLTYYLGFFVVTNLIRDRRQLSVLINGLFVIAILASLAILIQTLIPSLSLVQSRTGELGTAGREYAGVLRTYIEAERLIYVMLLVSVCSLTLGGRWLPQMLEFARAGILGIGLFLGFQRNYWLTMLSMLALLSGLVSWPQRSRILRWGIVGLVAVTLLVSLSGGTFDRYVVAAFDRLVWGMRLETLAQDSSTQMRVTETGYAIQSIAQHPLLGIGLGNLYRPAMEGDAYWYPEDPSIGLRWYMHNAYLWVWVMAGLMGFIPFIWLYAGFLGRGFARWHKIGDPKLRVVVLGFTLGVLGQAISNVVAPNFVQSWILIVFAIIPGINELIFRWEISEAGP